MKRMTTLIGATAPLAILAAVGAAPNAYAQATVPCVQNAGADGVLGTPDDPENTLECGLGAEASAPGATAYGSGAKATGKEAMGEIGRASCRERVWQYGADQGGGVSLKKKKKVN